MHRIRRGRPVFWLCLVCGVGIGALNPEAALNRGLGLANIRGRLEQLYGEGQDFSIANRTAGGTEVTLRFPFHLAETSAQIP